MNTIMYTLLKNKIGLYYSLDKYDNEVFVTGTIGQQPPEVFKHIVNLNFFQDAPGRVEIRIVRKPSFTEELGNYLLEVLRVFPDLEFSINYVEAIEKTKSLNIFS